MITRKDVVNKAKEYLNTPWHHQGRLKGVGIDCAGLIVEVAKELGFYKGGDLTNYERIPDGIMLAQILNNQLEQIDFNKVNDGDILLFTVFNNPQHLGFYFKENNIEYFIHAYGEKAINKVVIMRLDTKWKNRISGVFKFKEIE